MSGKGRRRQKTDGSEWDEPEDIFGSNGTNDTRIDNTSNNDTRTDNTSNKHTRTDDTPNNDTRTYDTTPNETGFNKVTETDAKSTGESKNDTGADTRTKYTNKNMSYNNKYKTSRRKQEQANIAQLEKQLAHYKSRTNLSKPELEDFEYKQNLYDILKQDVVQEAEYQLPEDYINESGKIDKKRKLDVLKKDQDKRSEYQKKNRYENQWEKDQIRKAEAISKTTTDDIVVDDKKEYEYVFDESQFVKFDSDQPLEGDEPEENHHDSASNISNTRKSLPVYGYRDSFLQAVEANQVLIVVGETGSGKTTQLPQYLCEAGYCKKDNQRTMKVGCTQPRRVAATSVATRVAQEMGVSVGKEVGYSIRFEDKSSDSTIIKYLTDGTLLREFLNDPVLSQYSALMIDEAHERTISTEILLSLLKDITQERPDLRIIVASATINAQKFSDFFNGAPIFNIPGRRFPVNIHYTQQPEANYIQAAINTIFLIHSKKPLPGDILVFLTGQDEIETMQENLLEASDKLGSLVGELIVCPIYANLPQEYQRRIFEPTPPNARKIVLATNIAETSITIDGIKYVIDSGYVKENVYNPSTGMDSLVVVPCSKASADQRAGRAGRVGPGECFRLYTKWSFNNELLTNATPEILRANLTSTVLLLLSLGITDLINFDFMDPPSSETLIKCLELLYAIGALNSKGELTRTGRQMAEFPIDPMFSKCLLSSGNFGVTNDITAIIAMLGESANLFYRPKDKKLDADKKKEFFNDPTGDHLSLLNVWTNWSDTGFSSIWCQENFIQYKTLKRVKDVREQLQGLCRKAGLDISNESNNDQKSAMIQKCVVSGFFPHVVKLSRMGDSYRTLKKNQAVYIHPSSAIFHVKPPPKLVLYHELVLTSKEYMRNCMIIEDEWLQELAPHYYSSKELETLGKNTANRYK